MFTLTQEIKYSFTFICEYNQDSHLDRKQTFFSTKVKRHSLSLSVTLQIEFPVWALYQSLSFFSPTYSSILSPTVPAAGSILVQFAEQTGWRGANFAFQLSASWESSRQRAQQSAAGSVRDFFLLFILSFVFFCHFALIPLSFSHVYSVGMW